MQLCRKRYRIRLKLSSFLLIGNQIHRFDWYWNCWSWTTVQCHNNKIVIISKTVFMVLSSWQSHCKSSPGSFDECRTAPSGCRSRPSYIDDLGCESINTGCQSLYQPYPFIIITQPKSWYSFHHPTEGRRLSRPIGWLHTQMVYPPTDGHPSSTGFDVAQLRWSRPKCYH